MAYAVRSYLNPGSRSQKHHYMRQMRRAGHRRLELLQQLRGTAQAAAGYPENLPPLLQPNS
jgi:hypothetical protein